MSKTFKPNYLYFAAFAGVLAYVAIGGFHALATVEGGQLASQVFIALVASIATFLLWVIGRKFYDYRRGLLLDDEGISCDVFVRRFGDRTIPWSKISDAKITSDSVSLARPRLFFTIRIHQDTC